jgi:hypothetical protein
MPRKVHIPTESEYCLMCQITGSFDSDGDLGLESKELGMTGIHD